MTQTYDYRFADGTDAVQQVLSPAGAAALRNIAYLDGNPAVHIALAATKTGFAAVKLTAKSSGRCDVNCQVDYAAVAGDNVTFTVDLYTDAVAGTPLTLPANATATGTNCYVDSTGAGIAPSAGATAVHTVSAPSQTIGTAGASLILSWDGLVALAAGAGVPAGQTFYAVFSVTNSVAARAFSQLAMGAFELP